MTATPKYASGDDSRDGMELPFPGHSDTPAQPEPQFSTGILPSQELRALIHERRIWAQRKIPGTMVQPAEIPESQIQPASLDLRLGPVAYRVRASFLPGKNVAVEQKIDELAMHTVDLANGAVLERHCVYIVPLMENVRLGWRVSARGNPKSSAGRLDIFTRLIADGATEFDTVRSNYSGPLYAEISPRAFSVVVREGSRLCQLRIQRGNPQATDTAMRKLQEDMQVINAETRQVDVSGGLAVSVDLSGDPLSGIVGYRAKHHTGLIDVENISHYEAEEYWDPVRPEKNGGLVLNPGDFYILASKESISVPPDYAAEMVAYDTLVGEFRVHYAGFFDPGFGYAEAGGAGSRAVLEVRSHEVPFIIEDGQVVGRLLYERLTSRPDKLYGQAIGSSYQRQGLQLSKQFKKLSR